MLCFQLTYDSKTFTDGSKNTRTYNSSLKCCIRCAMKFTVQKHFLKVLLAEASARQGYTLVLSMILHVYYLGRP